MSQQGLFDSNNNKFEVKLVTNFESSCFSKEAIQRDKQLYMSMIS
jgi:hypothetical protein